MHPLFVEFDEWYEMAHPRVLATVLPVTGDLDRAADSTDEAFTRALARCGSVGRMQSPIGWTVRVAINVANRLRRSSIARLLRREVSTADRPAHWARFVPSTACHPRHILAPNPPRGRDLSHPHTLAPNGSSGSSMKVCHGRLQARISTTGTKPSEALSFTEPRFAVSHR